MTKNFNQSNITLFCQIEEWTKDLIDNRDLQILQSFDPVER